MESFCWFSCVLSNLSLFTKLNVALLDENWGLIQGKSVVLPNSIEVWMLVVQQFPGWCLWDKPLKSFTAWPKPTGDARALLYLFCSFSGITAGFGQGANSWCCPMLFRCIKMKKGWRHFLSRIAKVLQLFVRLPGQLKDWWLKWMKWPFTWRGGWAKPHGHCCAEQLVLLLSVQNVLVRKAEGSALQCCQSGTFISTTCVCNCCRAGFHCLF